MTNDVADALHMLVADVFLVLTVDIRGQTQLLSAATPT